MSTGKHIVISAGGTGGHMSPAAALANNLSARGFRVSLMTDSRGARYLNMFDTVPHYITRAGTAGAGLKGKVIGAVNILRGLIEARGLIHKLKPDLVVGFGGYPSFPAVYIAQKKDIPTILHEQNAVIGKANAALAGQAERIALSLPNTIGLEKADQMRAVITGNPVRPAIVALSERAYDAPAVDAPCRILIMGGSQGATILSRVVPDALCALSDALRARLDIVQQCRPSDMAEVAQRYKDAGIKADVQSFFDDAAGEMAKAHLFIGRSGASTVAEISIAGVPAIYVPFAGHVDAQQERNAASVVAKGGAWVMTEDAFTPDALCARLESMMSNPQGLSDAAAAAKSCGKPKAAQKLGNLVVALVGR